MEDIYDAAMKIINDTKDMSFDDFMQDDRTVDAVIRNFEIIGEAANRVPDDFKTENPEIEWRRIIGFRNRIIHEYFGIQKSLCWVATRLYEHDKLSLRQAAELVGLAKRTFAELLGRNNASIFNYPSSDVSRDVANA